MNAAHELDDLRQAWQALDRRLERQYALDLQQFRDSRLRRAQGPLQRLASGQVVQLAAGSIVAALFAAYAWHQADRPHVLLAAAFLAAYAAMCAAFAIRDLVLIQRIDYTSPVVEIQKRLAVLREWHAQTSVGFVVMGCLMWVPLTQLAFLALGADLWVNAPSVLVGLWGSAAACLLVAWGLVRASRRPDRSALAHFVERTSLGASVIKARAALEEIERFERE